MHIFKKIIYSFIFFIFVLPTSAIPIIFIDVDSFDFPEEARKGIRVVAFDTETQKYNDIRYFDYTEQNLEVEDWLSEVLRAQEKVSFHISSKGNICIESTFDQTQYYLRTYAKIYDRASQLLGNQVQFNRSIKTILSPEISSHDGNNIFSFLSSFGSDVSTPDFKCISGLMGQTRTFSEIIKGIGEKPNNKVAEKASSRERGRLGELATEATMLSFACQGILSKNASDQGFDGVWINSMDNTAFLFLSESKCQNQKKSAEAYLQDDMNYDEITRKLKEKTPPETQTIIEKFIHEKPDNIFILVQRLKRNGQVQSCIRKFDLYSYQLSTIFKNVCDTSSREEKGQVLKALAVQMHLSPQEMISLILESTLTKWKYDMPQPDAPLEINMAPAIALPNISLSQDDGFTSLNSGLSDLSLGSSTNLTSPIKPTLFSYGSPTPMVTPATSPMKPMPFLHDFLTPAPSPITSPIKPMLSPYDSSTPAVTPVTSPTKSIRSIKSPSTLLTSPNKAFDQDLFSYPFFRSFSYDKVIKLIQVIYNEKATLGHKKVSLEQIGLLGGYEGKSNIAKVLQNAAPQTTARAIWSSLVDKLDIICKDYGILRYQLIKTCVEDAAFQNQ